MKDKITKIFGISNLSKSFGDLVVLDSVTFDIYKGQVLCIIGKSGIGKSVLIKHLNALLLPDSGKIFYKSKDISEFRPSDLIELRKEVSMLFQSGALFDSMNIKENLALPLKEHSNMREEEIDSLVSEKLKLVNMESIEDKFPSELSGGMKKRAALARAIIREPEVILYDEPTTGLDPVISDIINDLIRDMNRKFKITSVVITHDMKTVRKIADRVIMISDCNIIFDGSVDELELSVDPRIKEFIS